MPPKSESVTREEVKNARSTLISQSKKVTHGAVRVALGNRGSFSTIGRFLGEIEAEEKISSDSPAAQEVLGKLWSEARTAVQAEFAAKLEEQIERTAELQEEVVRIENEGAALLKELDATRLREQANADALRKALADLDIARTGQTTAEASAAAAVSRAQEAITYAGDVKGVLSAIAKSLAEITAAGSDLLLSGLEKQIQTYLNRLESVAPGQETRAVFLQILEIDQTRREFDKARAQFESERSGLVREQTRLAGELNLAQKNHAVVEEQRRGLDRVIEGHKEALRLRDQQLKEAAERERTLQAQLATIPEKFLALETKWDGRIEELRNQLSAAVARATQAESELAASKARISPK